MSSMVPDTTDWLAADGDVKIATITCDDDIVSYILDAATMLPIAPKGKGG